jgi:hypothetical protein
MKAMKYGAPPYPRARPVPKEGRCPTCGAERRQTAPLLHAGLRGPTIGMLYGTTGGQMPYTA